MADSSRTHATLAADAPCRNCGAPAPSAFCPECGQKTLLHPPTVPEFLHELVGHYFAAEGKLWRTLALLAFRPGRLTTEYLQGRRLRYIIPLRLYLSVSFVFFLIVNTIVPNTGITTVTGLPIDSSQSTPATVTKNGDHVVVKPKGLGLVAVVPPGAQLDAGDATVTNVGGHLHIVPKDSKEQAFDVDMTGRDFGLDRCLDENSNCPAWKHRLAVTRDSFKRDPDHATERFTARMKDNASYALFALLPIFALLLSGVYRNRHMYYGEHLVFSLHLHTFWLLVLLVLVFLPGELTVPVSWLVFLYGVWAMHQVYRGRWLPTILRGVFVTAVYGTMVGIATAGLVMYLILT